MSSRITSECLFFTGLQHAHCSEGVSYNSLRDVSGGGMARWPCLTLAGRPAAATVCPKRQLMTETDREKREIEICAAVRGALGAISSGKCPACESSSEPSRVDWRLQVRRVWAPHRTV